MSLNRDDEMPVCEVYVGLERIDECEAWHEFIHYNEIKMYGRG